MPWLTPTLRQVREMVRDDVMAALRGSVVIGNNVLRVMSDATGGLGHLNLRYLDWQARQYLPDTSEAEWLARHGNIWLTNSDGSRGRKSATLASGTVTVVGTRGTIIPQGSVLVAQTADGQFQFEITQQIVCGVEATPCPVTALDGGAAGNIATDETLLFVEAIAGIDGVATVVSLKGGANEETDDELRLRVLNRIRQPPMGGDEQDYINWALAVPGVTRAWSYPNQMGIGTVTVRFMCDDLRADNHGFPADEDVRAVTNYLNSVRPVTVKDFWVIAPQPKELELTIENLAVDSEAVRAAIETNINNMLLNRSAPGVTIKRSWMDEAISRATGEDQHDLEFDNAAMPTANHVAILGGVIYQ